MNTSGEILAQLDQCAANYTFPMLDNGYIYPADARLTIFRSNTEWLMVIEALGAYSPRVSGYTSFQNCLHLFGSALHRPPGTANEDFLYPISGCADDPLFQDEFEWFAKDDAHCVLIKGTRVELDLAPDALAKKGIQWIEAGRKDPAGILRSLLPEHRSSLLASEDELAKRNPHALPLWMRVDEWNHPDLASNELPSQSETFQMLAEAIATGDMFRYFPTKSPNTHWRFWPEGGTL
jgi:hypothetical protein